jgi:ribosomal protein L16/L10AE
MLTAEPQPEMTEALAAAIVTWIATCVQRSDWQEAMRLAGHKLSVKTKFVKRFEKEGA